MSTHKSDPAPLTPEARRFLEGPRFGVLATVNPDGMPQQTVVWYELRGNVIIMNTRAGRLKERNLRRDPRVSLCIADGYKYATFRGTVEFDDDPERAQADIKALAVRYKGQEEGQREWERVYSKLSRVTISLPVEDVYLYGF